MCRGCINSVATARELKRKILSIDLQYQNFMEGQLNPIIAAYESIEPKEENGYTILKPEDVEIPLEELEEEVITETEEQITEFEYMEEPLIKDEHEVEQVVEQEELFEDLEEESVEEEEQEEEMQEEMQLEQEEGIKEDPEESQEEDQEESQEEEQEEYELEEITEEITSPKIDGRKVRREITCTLCGDVFTSVGGFRLHQTHLHKDHAQVEKRDPSLVCEVCGKGFPNRSMLNWHAKIHSDRKPEQCGICGKFCLRLKVHIKHRHTDAQEKRPCPVCNALVLHLRPHMLTHKEKRFKCPRCDKAFATHVNLKRHENVHTGERVKCMFCDHWATHMDNSRLHMRSKHPDEYDEYKAQNQQRLLEPL